MALVSKQLNWQNRHTLKRLRDRRPTARVVNHATELRRGGDWRGACRAVQIDPAIDGQEVASLFGAETASRLEDDLRHLVPDLLRWHLYPFEPRRVVLATYRFDHSTEDGPCSLWLEQVGPSAAWYRLRAGAMSFLPTDESLEGARHLFDSRHSRELLERSGGDFRAPCFHADGSRGFETVDDDGPAERAEWIADRQFEHRFDEVLAEVGIEQGLDEHPGFAARQALAATWRWSWTTLVAEAGRLEPQPGSPAGVRVHVGAGYQLWIDLRGRRPRLDVGDHAPTSTPTLARELAERPLDLDLLHFELIEPDAVHPLVANALFPARPSTGTMAGPSGSVPDLLPFRVRCHGVWHTMSHERNRLTSPHSEEEIEREIMLHGLGAPIKRMRQGRRRMASRPAEGHAQGAPVPSTRSSTTGSRR